jgi:hypothetical protein
MMHRFLFGTGVSAVAALVALIGCGNASSDAPPTSCASTGGALSVAPPRLLLTDSILTRLQQRAAAGDAAWLALKSHCDGLTGGKVNPPNGDAYPSYPNVGQGYQGDGYLPEILSAGLCYRVVYGNDATAAATYAATAKAILLAMATPASSGGEPPQTDDGYGIRNYVVGMALGYDWVSPSLDAATKQAVITTLNAWIDWYDTKGFSNSEPIGNYFAGYLMGKTATAIATDGDDPKAATYWADVQTRMWGQLVEPSFTKSMKGGGWPEGWEYGPRSVQNYADFLWGVQTAKGIDWSSAIPSARDEAVYLSYFTWPSLLHIDDQGTVHAGVTLTPDTATVTMLAMQLEYRHDSYAATARSFAKDVLAAKNDAPAAWQAFLYWDDSLPIGDYTTQPLSYHASGPGHVAVRSSWAKDAVWGAFSSGAYIDAPDSGEQTFNEGSLTVVSGDQPLLVNAAGRLPQSGGDPGETFVYDDNWGTAGRRLYNVFYVSDSNNPHNPGQTGTTPDQARTHVERYEEGGSFVRARGANIEDMYGGSGGSAPVTQFMRDMVYVRPRTFVVYDRTTVSHGNADQWLSWHTAYAPAMVATSDVTQVRYDIASGGAVLGSVRSLLPRSAKSTTTNLVGGAAYRLENHAPTPAAAGDWLTVVTVGADVPDQVRLSSADANVSSGNVVGVHLKSAREAVVLFSADHAGAATVSAAEYAVHQTATADHLVFDVAPSASGYSVTTTAASGGVMTVHIAQGGPLTPSAQGTLAFVVSPTGDVSQPPPPPSGGGDGGTPAGSGGGQGAGGGGNPGIPSSGCP